MNEVNDSCRRIVEQLKVVHTTDHPQSRHHQIFSADTSSSMKKKQKMGVRGRYLYTSAISKVRKINLGTSHHTCTAHPLVERLSTPQEQARSSSSSNSPDTGYTRYNSNTRYNSSTRIIAFITHPLFFSERYSSMFSFVFSYWLQAGLLPAPLVCFLLCFVLCFLCPLCCCLHLWYVFYCVVCCVFCVLCAVTRGRLVQENTPATGRNMSVD